MITEDAFGFPIHKVVNAPAPWRLLKIARPLRLSSTPTGIEPDGWVTPPLGSPNGSPAFSAYNQFSTPGDKPGWIRIHVSREGWRGTDKPGKVTIKAGPLVRGADKQPALGKVVQVLHWTVHSGKTRDFYVRAVPPTRVELTVSPTFSPYEFGGSDRRQLGRRSRTRSLRPGRNGHFYGELTPDRYRAEGHGEGRTRTCSRGRRRRRARWRGDGCRRNATDRLHDARGIAHQGRGQVRRRACRSVLGSRPRDGIQARRLGPTRPDEARLARAGRRQALCQQALHEGLDGDGGRRQGRNVPGGVHAEGPGLFIAVADYGKNPNVSSRKVRLHVS